jgi:hypothetical protein
MEKLNSLLKIYFISTITFIVYYLITKPKKEQFKQNVVKQNIFKQNILVYLLFLVISIILFYKKEANLESNIDSVSRVSDIFLIN